MGAPLIYLVQLCICNMWVGANKFHMCYLCLVSWKFCWPNYWLTAIRRINEISCLLIDASHFLPSFWPRRASRICVSLGSFSFLFSGICRGTFLLQPDQHQQRLVQLDGQHFNCVSWIWLRSLFAVMLRKKRKSNKWKRIQGTKSSIFGNDVSWNVLIYFF